MGAMPELVLIHETEEACRQRLLADGFAPDHAFEISSYLAQSTDLAADFPAIAEACARRGLAFVPLPLDEAPPMLAALDPRSTLVWTLTDGIAYFRGGVAPALARLYGLPVFGSDDSLFALCQDKFRAGSVLGALGLPAPPSGLARDGEWIVAPPEAAAGYFVKPNRLGAKIGIWPQSHCASADEALALSRRIHAAYRDDAIVQPYVAGRNVRASFLAADPAAGVEALGVFFVDSGGDFQTMADSLLLYGETGAAAKAEGRQAEPDLRPVAETQPAADGRIRGIAARLMRGLGLKDVFSLDFRVDGGGSRPSHRVRGLPRPALLRLPLLLPRGVGHGSRGGHGGCGRGEAQSRLARQTEVCPRLTKPSARAAALDRSTMRPLMKGPRSLILTTTALPLRLLVTRTCVPSGRVRCAAVKAYGFMRSPEAVRECSAYQDAPPHCAAAEKPDNTKKPAASVAAASAVEAFDM